MAVATQLDLVFF